MRRILYLLLILSLNLSAQIPENYYDGTSGLKGDELKTQLHNIIKGHKEFPYSSSSTDTWDILKESDRDPNNSSNVILFYTGWSISGPKEYDDNKGWNREHVWAKSHGDFGTSKGPGTDCHHLRPSDISVNGKRDSRWFDNGGVVYTDPDGKTECRYSDANYTWEPRDEVKGDVARIIFYMATRYEGESGEPDLEVIDYLPSNDHTSEPVHAKLSTLLEWHKADPVSDFERNRNKVVYSYQNNRNPFIDHPEFVEQIYVDNTGIKDQKESAAIIAWPNPVKDVLHISESYTGQKEIYNCLGKKVKSFNGNQINISDFDNGLYIIKIKVSENKSEFVKVIKK